MPQRFPAVLRWTLVAALGVVCCAGGGCTPWLFVRSPEKTIAADKPAPKRPAQSFDAHGGFYTPWARVDGADRPGAKRDPARWIYGDAKPMHQDAPTIQVQAVERANPGIPARLPIGDAEQLGHPQVVEPVQHTSSNTLPKQGVLTVDVKRPKDESRAAIVEALDCILHDRHADALRHLQKYDQATQELFLRLLPVMALMTQKPLDELSPAEIAVLQEQLHSLLATIRPRTALVIDKMCFCEWVENYGCYKPLPEGHAFLRSTDNRPGELVQLYVEVRNFASEPRGGFFETKLANKVEIRPQGADPASAPTWYFNFTSREKPLRRRTMLHDYFNYYSFTVPNNIPAGVYTLTVQIIDETRPDQPRVARKSTEFRVTSVAARAP